ncbi:MAG: protein kinase [Pirellulaceae bacterium]|nr:protein kinase [Pirellulaceae bacterium]
MSIDPQLDEPGGCPSQAELAAYLDGALPGESSERIATHIETCQSCETALSALHPGADDFAVTLRQRMTRSPEQFDDGFGKFEQQVRHVGAVVQEQPSVAAPAALPKQSARLGAYRLLGHLGKGGMGQVFLAEHVHLKRTVALKILPPERANDPVVLRRFYREMEAIGRLEHPNVVRARDAGEAEGYHFLVMDYVPGIDLRGLLAASGPWTVADACEAMRQTALGLEYIRQNELVHRDIKPANLIVTRAGRVKILDLGLARLRRPDGDGSQLTGSDAGLGTYDFIAPEQIRRASAVDIRADLYSVGCTLYALLAGRPPFHDRAVYEKLFAHCNDPVPPLSEKRSGVPESLLAILNSLLAKLPADRFENPALLGQALTPLCEGHRLSELAAQHVAADAPADIDETDEWLSTSVHDDTDRRIAGNKAGIGARPEPTRSRRTVWLTWGLAIASCILLTVAGGVYGPELALRWLPGRGPSSPSVPSPTPEQLQLQRPNLDAVPLNRWVRLLEFEPREVFWPQDGLSNWFYSPQQEQITLQSNHIGLLELGEVHRANYRIQIGLQQPRWDGGIGVFFGLHPTTVDDRPGLTYQFLMLTCPRRDGANREYRLTRGIERVFVSDAQERQFQSQQLMSENVDVTQGEQIFELCVENHDLKAILWNGKVLSRIHTVLAGHSFTEEDFVGGFGVVAQTTSGTVREARFMATATLRSAHADETSKQSP